MFHSSLAISGEFLNRKQQRPTLDRPAIKSRTSWVHLSPVLPIPGGLHNRLSCPSIRPHSSEGKLAGKLDTGSLCVSRLLRGGETRVKFRPLFPNVEEWPLIVPHPFVACCCGGTWHWRCYWSAAGGADSWSHRHRSSVRAPYKGQWQVCDRSGC